MKEVAIFIGSLAAALAVILGLLWVYAWAIRFVGGTCS